MSAEFAAAALSDEALLTADAQPAELIRRITRAARQVGLNEAESSLYDRLFTECVQWCVRIVRSLPVFEERAATTRRGGVRRAHCTGCGPI